GVVRAPELLVRLIGGRARADAVGVGRAEDRDVVRAAEVGVAMAGPATRAVGVRGAGGRDVVRAGLPGQDAVHLDAVRVRGVEPVVLDLDVLPVGARGAEDAAERLADFDLALRLGGVVRAALGVERERRKRA